MKKIILVIVLFIPVLELFAQEVKPAAEVCYNPNLVKDTSKKIIKSMAFAVVKTIQ